MDRPPPMLRWHAVLLTALAAGAVAPAVAQQGDGGCVRGDCHSEYRGPRFPHDPVAKGSCTACHVPIRDGHGAIPLAKGEAREEFEPPRGGEACGECHEPAPTFHDPGADSGQDPCLRCHDPHGGASAALLRASEEELCLACHAGPFAARRSRGLPRRSRSGEAKGEPEEPEIFEHGPLAEGRCGPCHPAHAAGPDELLRGELPAGLYARYDRPIYSSCYGSCHSPDLVEEERTTEATRFRNGDDNLHYRHVVRRARSRSCRLCHAPHLAFNRALIRRGMPFGKERLTLVFTPTELGGRCTTSCHIPAEYDRSRAIPSRMRVPETTPTEGRR